MTGNEINMSPTITFSARSARDGHGSAASTRSGEGVL